LRRENAQFYIEQIKNSEIVVPAVSDWKSHVFHIFPVRCKRRKELKDFLWNNKIQTNIHYPIPPHKQECYKEWNRMNFPITEQIHNEELSLPMSQILSQEEISYIVDKINTF
jgi:dTDP-4-amino-4,6-dideoxygalactose transaminase